MTALFQLPNLMSTVAKDTRKQAESSRAKAATQGNTGEPVVSDADILSLCQPRYVAEALVWNGPAGQKG